MKATKGQADGKAVTALLRQKAGLRMAVQPPPERFREVLDTCAHGFGATRFTLESAEREETVWELDRTWVVEDGDEYVATATAYAFAMTVPGGARVPAAGVAQVGVLPTHRRRGLLRDVLGALLEQAAGWGTTTPS